MKINSPLIFACLAGIASMPIPNISSGRAYSYGHSMREKDGIVTDSSGKQYKRHKDGSLRKVK